MRGGKLRDDAIMHTLVEDGECTIGELAYVLGVSKSTISRRVRRMEARGLITA
jgi:DNA-binding MarR family transcriptional regulator